MRDDMRWEGEIIRIKDDEKKGLKRQITKNKSTNQRKQNPQMSFRKRFKAGRSEASRAMVMEGELEGGREGEGVRETKRAPGGGGRVERVHHTVTRSYLCCTR